MLPMPAVRQEHVGWPAGSVALADASVALTAVVAVWECEGISTTLNVRCSAPLASPSRRVVRPGPEPA